jgi:hypothetical protein
VSKNQQQPRQKRTNARKTQGKNEPRQPTGRTAGRLASTRLAPQSPPGYVNIVSDLSECHS